MPNNRTPKYLRHKLIGLIVVTDNSLIIVEDFTTPLSVIGKTTKQKISMVQEDSKSTVDLFG